MARDRKSLARKKGAACGGPPPNANPSDVCGLASHPESTHHKERLHHFLRALARELAGADHEREG